MLGQRVVTAVVLLIILAAVMAAPGPLPFAILVAVFGIAALFEWWRLTLARAVPTGVQGGMPLANVLFQGETGLQGGLRVLATAAGLALAVRLLLDYSVLGGPVGVLLSGAESAIIGFGTLGWVQLMQQLVGRTWIWAMVGWVAVLGYLFVARTDKAPFSVLLTAFGLLAVPAACAALLVAYGHGVLYLVSLLGIVWAADIGAYFVGRRVGGAKLAPRISPGKTISGAIGGMVCAILWVVGCAAFASSTPVGPSTYGGDLVAHWGWLGAVGLTALLAVFSVAGDLFESLLKRRAGRKDSSQLLPGHGGVFDRIDAVLPTAPLAMLLVLS